MGLASAISEAGDKSSVLYPVMESELPQRTIVNIDAYSIPGYKMLSVFGSCVYHTGNSSACPVDLVAPRDWSCGRNDSNAVAGLNHLRPEFIIRTVNWAITYSTQVG